LAPASAHPPRRFGGIWASGTAISRPSSVVDLVEAPLPNTSRTQTGLDEQPKATVAGFVVRPRAGKT